MELTRVFAGQEVRIDGGDVDVTALAYDSRRVGPGSLFAAIPGAKSDGHAFIDTAVKQGAVAVLCEREVDVKGATRVIAKDSRVLLPDPNNSRDSKRMEPIPQTVLSKKFAADIGTIAEQRQMGVTHIAVSESDYGTFSRRGVRPKKDDAADFERRRAFYTTLLRNNTPLFQRDRGTVLYLHPGIRLYAMPPAE